MKLTKGMSYLIAFIVLTILFSAIIYFSVPKKDERFIRIKKHIDLLLLSGSEFLYPTFKQQYQTSDLEGSTYERKLLLLGNKKKPIKLYVYIHSLRNFVDGVFIGELIEYEFKAEYRGLKKSKTYLNAYYLTSETGENLDEKIIDLGDIKLTMRLKNRFITTTNGKDVFYTKFAIGIKSEKYDEFIWRYSLIYNWVKKFENRPWLSTYDSDSDEYILRDGFCEELF